MSLPSYLDSSIGTATGGGHSAFGSVPNATPLPDPFGNLSSVYPNLTATNTAVSGDIMNELKGVLSPETVANIQDNAASFGVSSGMPGSDFAGYKGLRSLGLTTEGLQQQGLKDYNSTIPTIFGTQTLNPQLQSEIEAYNNQLAAAPDPKLAAEREQSLFDQYMKKTQGPQGGSGQSWWQQALQPGTYHSVSGVI